MLPMPSSPSGPDSTSLSAPDELMVLTQTGRVLWGLVACILLAALGLGGWHLHRSAGVLGGTVAQASASTEANVWVAGQTQRELLTLAMQLGEDADAFDADEVALTMDLVDSRIGQLSRPDRLWEMGPPALAETTLELAAAWERDILPTLGAALGGDVEVRRTAAEEVLHLEHGFNLLARAAEEDRQRRAAATVGVAAALGGRTQLLVVGSVAAGVGLLLVLAVVVWKGRRHDEVRNEMIADLRRLALVADHTTNHVIVTDAEGRLLTANRALLDKTGYSMEELAGMTPGTLLSGPDTNPDTVEYIRSHIVEGLEVHAEATNYTKDGREYRVLSDFTPVHDHLGRLTNYVVVEVDLTQEWRARGELKAAKEAAERAAAEAEAASEARQQFLKFMSHEIRTPLNGVIGGVDMLQDTGLRLDQRRILDTVQQSGRLLLRLIDNILIFTSLERGTDGPAADTLFSPVALADEALTAVATEAARKGIDLKLDPAGSTPPLVVGDERSTIHSLLNLVGNAVKYTDAGSVTVRMLYGPDGQGGEMLTFEVADTGIGMTDEQMARMFEPFIRVGDGGEHSYDGGGLGLANTRALVEDRMGGSITIVSDGPGTGTTAYMSLPVRMPTDAERAAAEESVSSAAARLEGVSILMAEDDETNQMVARNMLERMGASVHVVDDGVAAVDAAVAGSFDVILMDINMPGLDGVSAMERIRKRLGEEAPPIVALTAAALDGDRAEFLRAGMDDYVSKPLVSDRLRLTVRRVLARREPPPPVTGSGLVDRMALAEAAGTDDEDLLNSLLVSFAEEIVQMGSSAIGPAIAMAGELGQRRVAARLQDCESDADVSAVAEALQDAAAG